MTRILVVDDDPVSRLLLTHLLTSGGYEVEVAVDGRDALEAIQGGDRFDGIISDELMPRLGGRELRSALGPDLDVPFVLLTGTVLDPDEIPTAGVDRCLTKPVRSSTLSEMMRALFGTAPSGRKAAASESTRDEAVGQEPFGDAPETD